ncbi:hypothetical protein YC2023_081472 [Brassica napus]
MDCYFGFSGLESRLRVEALAHGVALSYSSNSVALGKDDQIAWCWTLGPPE